jgi:glycosyltransferase involved in cell wall biosynthesis
LDGKRIDLLPYVFVPDRELLSVPAATNFKAVTFLGRLEVRKGVVALGDAIPMVLRTHPDTVFRFVGRTGPAPSGGRSMVDYLRTRLAAHLDRIEFVDHVPPERIAGCLAQTDVCVFPSLWENFPNVCLEAMSAARGIVASREGGMQDMLDDIAGGILIDPASSSQLAHAVIRMLDRPLERQQMGARSRAKIVEYYGQEVPRLTDEYYSAAISSLAVRRRAAA